MLYELVVLAVVVVDSSVVHGEEIEGISLLTNTSCVGISFCNYIRDCRAYLPITPRSRIRIYDTLISPASQALSDINGAPSSIL